MSRASFQAIAPADRIVALDLWRGFALLGVCVVNFFVANDDFLPVHRAEALVTAPVDWRATYVLRLLVSNKAHTIFSFLFGIGIAIMAGRANRAQVDPHGILARRLGILFLIGILHFILLFHADVLHRYALVGAICLLMVRRLPGRAVVVLGVVLAVFSRVVYEEREFLIGLFNLPVDVAAGMAFDADWLYSENRTGGVLPYVALNASRAVAVLRNYPEYLAVGGHFLGRVLLGYAFWTSGLCRTILAWSTARLMRLAGLVLSVVLIVAWTGGLLQPSGAGTAAHFFLNVLRHCNFLVLASLYLVLLIVALRLPALDKVTSLFALVGRMSLTNYVLQTFGIVFVFSGAGLTLAGDIGAAPAILLAIVFFAAQGIFSAFWLQRFRQGPLEYVWRRLVYGGSGGGSRKPDPEAQPNSHS